MKDGYKVLLLTQKAKFPPHSHEHVGWAQGTWIQTLKQHPSKQEAHYKCVKSWRNKGVPPSLVEMIDLPVAKLNQRGKEFFSRYSYSVFGKANSAVTSQVMVKPSCVSSNSKSCLRAITEGKHKNSSSEQLVFKKSGQENSLIFSKLERSQIFWAKTRAYKVIGQ